MQYFAGEIVTQEPASIHLHVKIKRNISFTLSIVTLKVINMTFRPEDAGFRFSSDQRSRIVSLNYAVKTVIIFRIVDECLVSSQK